MQIKEINIKKFKMASESEKALGKEKMDKYRKEYYKMVKGMFEFLDAQGGWFEFNHRIFPDDPISTIRIDHGEIVDLPIGIVRHLNNTVQKVRQMPTEIGSAKTDRMHAMPYQKRSRVRFTTMDVM